MIKKLYSNTDKKTFEKLVNIHKECVYKINSQVYSSNQIHEWLSTISIENIKSQLDNTSWVFIEEQKDIVGFAQFSIDDREIYQIQILPQKQNRGFGKKLYQHIEKAFLKNNANEISLFATLNAVPFYKSLGFRVVKNIMFKLSTTSLKMIEMKKMLPMN